MLQLTQLRQLTRLTYYTGWPDAIDVGVDLMNEVSKDARWLAQVQVSFPAGWFQY
jgi:hypothetical protein